MIESLQSFFIDPFNFEFMQRALVISLMIGSICALFSCFLVLKGWSLMGDAVSHAILPGLGMSYILGINLSMGAFCAGMTCALLTGYIKENSRIKEDAAMGVIFSGMFAFGLVLLTKIETDIHLMHVLFGNVLGIENYDFKESFIISALGIVILILKRKDFMLYCFDPIQVKVIGLPSKLIYYSLLSLLALTIVAGLKVVGIILVIAMLITPGATAFLLTKSFDKMLLISVLSAVISCYWGVLLSFHFDAATAPLIVVIQSFIFVLVLVSKLFIQKKICYEKK